MGDGIVPHTPSFSCIILQASRNNDESGTSNEGQLGIIGDLAPLQTLHQDPIMSNSYFLAQILRTLIPDLPDWKVVPNYLW